MKITPPVVILPLEEITIKKGNVRIFGNGVWGTALGSVISRPPAGLKVFIFALPTNVLRNVLWEVKDRIDNKTLVINASKGIEQKTHKLPYEIIEEVLGKRAHYFSLIGPGFAQEVVKKNPTIVNLGYRNKKYLAAARAVFQKSYFDVVPTPCLYAIEVMGSFKNIYAISCGIAEGLGYGVNTRTKLILLAYQELKKLLIALGHDYNRSAEIAFMGDLILTCSSTESRNFTFGKFLTRHSARESLNKIKETVEGLSSVSSVRFFEQKAQIKLPLARLIHDIIDMKNHRLAKKHFTDFILRSHLEVV
ncbi:MAG: hypothetical protein Q7S04_03030 [Candidatus Moranbacteria bacterium]|nr:hypothetical protein [Candidatus Moranbacteria bacterium]